MAGRTGNLTYAQLEGLWIRAGGPRNQAPTAAAIALAESGGVPGITNPNDNNGTQTSWGLWQISNGTHSPPSPRWSIPIVNARLAVAKYRAAGDSFAPWGTFNTGAYRKFMNNGTTPDFSAAGSGSTTATAAIGGTGGKDPGCLATVSLPSIGTTLPIVGNVGTPSGSVCLFRKSQARAFIGGLLIGGGGIVLFGSFAILVGAGLAKTQAVQQAVTLTGYVKAPYAAAGRQFKRKPNPKTQAGGGQGTQAPATASSPGTTQQSGAAQS